MISASCAFAHAPLLKGYLRYSKRIEADIRKTTVSSFTAHEGCEFNSLVVTSHLTVARQVLGLKNCRNEPRTWHDWLVSNGRHCSLPSSPALCRQGVLRLSRKYRFESKWRLICIDFGINVASLCARAQLPSSIFDSDDVWLNRAEFNRLWHALEAETGDPLIGLRIGQWIASETYEPCMVAAYCAANLMQALDSLSDYNKVVSPFSWRTEVTPYSLEISIGDARDTAEGPVNGQAEVAIFASLVHSLRRATRDASICPLRVQLSMPFPDLKPLRAFFGVEPLIQGPASICIAAQDSTRPFLTHKPMFWRFLAPALRLGMQSAQQQEGTVEVVRQCLVELLPLGRTQIGDVATELGIGVRTLQRRLAVEDESFQSILRTTRERLTKQYLQDGDLSVEQISTLLGFESANSLYRAFQKWTGTTPEAFRESTRGA